LDWDGQADSESGKPFANRALDLDPADPDAIQALAEVAAETGKCKEALILQRRATSMLPAKAPAAEAFRKRLADYDARCGTATPAAASVVPPTAR
jgi:cytochrome c-type biogenesis protein CcmH/NrfG